MIEGRQRWSNIDEELSYFETQWKPKSWPRCCRFVMVRTRVKQQQKGPVQLDLFEPYEYGYEFKVIVTNKDLTAASLVDYHGGRGSQEGVFGELKTQCQMDYIPVRKRCANETSLLASSVLQSDSRFANATGATDPRDDSQASGAMAVRESQHNPPHSASTRRSPFNSLGQACPNILHRQEPPTSRIAILRSPRGMTNFLQR